MDIILTPRFPFAPPSVKIVDAGTDLTPTFHIEKDGVLCLWGNGVPVHDAPWRRVEDFLQKVGGWFSNTADGWPDDNDADLERYLINDDDRIILYAADTLEGQHYYRTSTDDHGIIRIGDELPWTPKYGRMKNKGIRRRERHLLWSVDVGQLDHPIRNWVDLVDVVDAAGYDCTHIAGLVGIGSVEYILVRYVRGEREAALALKISGVKDEMPALQAIESADTSTETRTLRAGSETSRYSEKKVAIVGCGAIGSQLAGLLFRSGVRHLTLVDPERMRPGNIVRHLATNGFVGLPKPMAVKAELNSYGLDVTNVKPVVTHIQDKEQAVKLLQGHDLVIDATADARATALLRWAAETLGRHMISVCLQRNGGIARVDKFPLWEGEQHFDPIEPLPDEPEMAYENGCGSAVSMTPPLAVIKAAALGCQVALDDLNMWRHPPATIVEVIEPQPDNPYDRLGIIASEMDDD